MPNTPRKNPTQERLRLEVDALLMAGAHILKFEGIEHFDVQRISQIAGLSVQTLQRYFEGADHILATLRKRNEAWFDECVQREFSRMRDLPTESAARGRAALVRAMHWDDAAEAPSSEETEASALPPAS